MRGWPPRRLSLRNDFTHRSQNRTATIEERASRASKEACRPLRVPTLWRARGHRDSDRCDADRRQAERRYGAGAVRWMPDAWREGGGGMIEPASLKFATCWKPAPLADDVTQLPMQLERVSCMATMCNSDIIFEAPMTHADCALVLLISGLFRFEASINGQAVNMRLYSAIPEGSAGMAKCVAIVA